MEIKGLVKFIGDTQIVSEKFSKREFVITMAGEYPQHISMQCTQAKVLMLDGLAIGQEINCHINLRGREWTNPTTNETKYFNTIECWKLETLGERLMPPEAGTADDDLPF